VTISKGRQNFGRQVDPLQSKMLHTYVLPSVLALKTVAACTEDWPNIPSLSGLRYMD